MELPFPIAMADQATLEARGPFGRVDARADDDRAFGAGA
jgi:hypothetical protein